MWSSVQEPVRGLQTPLLCTGDLKTKLNGGINFQLKKKKKKKKKKICQFLSYLVHKQTKRGPKMTLGQVLWQSVDDLK